MPEASNASSSGLFAERLRRARAMRGLSLRALSATLEGRVSYAALGKYEQGRMLPTSTVLIALAEALEVRPDYFFQSPAVTLRGIEFRKKVRFGKKKQAQVVEKAQDFFERYLEVERILAVQTPQHSRLDLRGITLEALPEAVEEAGAKIREQWQLGQEPLANVHELLEDHGVKVGEVDVDAGFNGLSGWAGETPIIVLAKGLNEDLPRKRLTELHELGHLLMALPDDVGTKQEERLCFRFAGAMLFPKARFLAEFGPQRRFGQVSQEELMAMKEQWGMSMAAIMRRARDLDRITADHYKRFCIQSNKLGWRTNEPGAWIGSEKACRFRQLVHRAAAQEAITRSKAAGLLGISVRAFDSQFGKAG